MVKRSVVPSELATKWAENLRDSTDFPREAPELPIVIITAPRSVMTRRTYLKTLRRIDDIRDKCDDLISGYGIEAVQQMLLNNEHVSKCVSWCDNKDKLTEVLTECIMKEQYSYVCYIKPTQLRWISVGEYS